MKISVIIPTFNRAQCIKRAIDSVLKQDYKPIEIIIINDGSTDNTAEILNDYGSAVKVIRQENKGVSAARNLGIRNACGDWIALLDSDDEWLPHKLKDNVQFSIENPQLEIFQCQEIWIRNHTRVNPRKKHQKYGGWIFEKCLPACIVSPSAVIIKKSLWLEMKGFDETYPVCEDYDLWLRIARKYEIGLDTRPGIIKYGGHDDQLSRKFDRIDAYRVMALEKHIFDPTLNNSHKRLVINEALKKLQVLLAGALKREMNGNIWQQKIVNLKKLRDAL